MLKRNKKKVLFSEKIDMYLPYFHCAKPIESICKKRIRLRSIKYMEILFELNNKSMCAEV